MLCSLTLSLYMCMMLENFKSKSSCKTPALASGAQEDNAREGEQMDTEGKKTSNLFTQSTEVID